MPAHLTGEERARFFHLRLDERMARLPHDGLPAVFCDIVEQALRAFHFADDAGTRVRPEDVSCEQREQPISPHRFSVSVDDAEPVAVSVEGDADPRADLAYRFD